MKGMVFTEFLDMVETQMGLAMVDRIITAADPPSGGVYTAVGTYDHAEMVSLVQALSAATGTPVSELLKTFGEVLFGRLVGAYPELIQHAGNSFELLRLIDGHIHVEVHKLYPDAELPAILCEDAGPDELLLTYQSRRGLADLAEGLIRGCIAHFGDTITLTRTELPSEAGLQCTRFRLHQAA